MIKIEFIDKSFEMRYKDDIHFQTLLEEKKKLMLMAYKSNKEYFSNVADDYVYYNSNNNSNYTNLYYLVNKEKNVSDNFFIRYAKYIVKCATYYINVGHINANRQIHLKHLYNIYQLLKEKSHTYIVGYLFDIFKIKTYVEQSGLMFFLHNMCFIKFYN